MKRMVSLGCMVQASSFPGCRGRHCRWLWPLWALASCPPTSTCTRRWCTPGALSAAPLPVTSVVRTYYLPTYVSLLSMSVLLYSIAERRDKNIDNDNDSHIVPWHRCCTSSDRVREACARPAGRLTPARLRGRRRRSGTTGLSLRSPCSARCSSTSLWCQSLRVASMAR